MKATGIVRRIDEAVKSVIAEGLKVEEQIKQVNKKWEEWSKETN